MSTTDTPRVPIDSLGLETATGKSVALKPMGGESNFGSNNLEAKMEAIDNAEDSFFTTDTLAEVGTLLTKFVRKDLPVHARTALKTVKHGLTPAFIRRMKRKKIHIQKVEGGEE
jgi:hypothetical protein